MTPDAPTLNRLALRLPETPGETDWRGKIANLWGKEYKQAQRVAFWNSVVELRRGKSLEEITEKTSAKIPANLMGSGLPLKQSTTLQ